MWNFTAWELLGIILVSLYFILSLFRQRRTGQELEQNSIKLEDEKLSDEGLDSRDDRRRPVSDDKESRKDDFSAEGIQERALSDHVRHPSPNTISANVAELKLLAEEKGLRGQDDHDKMPPDGVESTQQHYGKYPRDGAEDLELYKVSQTDFKSTIPTIEFEDFTKLTEVEEGTIATEGMAMLESNSMGIDLNELENKKEEAIISPFEINLDEKQQDLQTPVNSVMVMECTDSYAGLAEGFENASVISNYAENLVKDSTAKAVEELIQTQTSDFADDLSNEIVVLALDDLKDSEFHDQQSSSALESVTSLESSHEEQEEQLDNFVDELIKIVIDNAAIDIAKIKTFAQDLSDIIFTECTHAVLTEVNQTDKTHETENKDNDIHYTEDQAEISQNKELKDLSGVSDVLSELTVSSPGDHTDDHVIETEFVDNLAVEDEGIENSQPENTFLGKSDKELQNTERPAILIETEIVDNHAIKDEGVKNSQHEETVVREPEKELQYTERPAILIETEIVDNHVVEDEGVKNSQHEDTVVREPEKELQYTERPVIVIETEVVDNLAIEDEGVKNSQPENTFVGKSEEELQYTESPVIVRETEVVENLAVEKEGVKNSQHEDTVVGEPEEELKYTEKPVIQLDDDEVISLNKDGDEDGLVHDETGPPSPQITHGHEEIKLRNKTVGKVAEGSSRISWRDSLILDLEEDPDLEDSYESELSEFGSPEPRKGPEFQAEKELPEDSDEFVDSEEDEIIDHAADAQLGAVGGSESNNNTKEEYDDDYYSDDDYSDDDNDHIFDPHLSVDGLCVSKPKEGKGRIKSVDSHYNRAIVLDNGCGITKIGFAGDRVPRVIQPAVVGMPQRFSMHFTGDGDIKDYKKYGDAAVAKAGVMHLGHPLHAGKIENWSDVVELWEYLLYDELDIGEGDHPVIITETAGAHKKNREKLTEILFEQFSVPAMYLADQLALSLYASGMTSGVSLSSGFSCTQAAVIYEGHTLNYTLQNLDIGGQQLTENLRLHLRDVRGHNFTSSSGWQIVNSVKEKMAYISKDYVNEVEKYKTSEAMTKHYQLPDGQMISIGYECIAAMEPLFKPDVLMLANDTTASQPPVHELITRAINRCDPDIQAMVRRNVIISGGTTTAQGFLARLHSELKHVQPHIKKLRAPEHRKFSPWIGGSILGSLSSFDNQYVTVDEYAESGARIVHRKCF